MREHKAFYRGMRCGMCGRNSVGICGHESMCIYCHGAEKTRQDVIDCDKVRCVTCKEEPVHNSNTVGCNCDTKECRYCCEEKTGIQDPEEFPDWYYKEDISEMATRARARRGRVTAARTARKAVRDMTKAEKEWNMVRVAIRTGQPTLIIGPPGSGKTEEVRDYAENELQKRLYVSNITRELLAQVVFMGTMMPNAKGGMFWMDAPGSRACREGCPYLINEVDKAGPDVEAGLYWVLETPERVTMTLPNPELEELRAKEGFQVIATMNGALDDLPDAILSRFVNKVMITTINPKAVEQLPEDLRAFARTGHLAHEDGSKRPPDLRKLFGFDRNRKQMPTEIAAELVFQHRASEFLAALTMAKSSTK